MAKKAPKNAKSNELDGKEFFTAISLIEKEKGIRQQPRARGHQGGQQIDQIQKHGKNLQSYLY